MKFVLQREPNEDIELDIVILERELKKQKYVHEWVYASINEIVGEEIEIRGESVCLKDVVPVGSLEFIREWIKAQYGVCRLNPIEVPNVLRDRKYLGRKYRIVNKKEVDNEYSFIKSARELKEFSYTGNPDNLINSDYMKDGLYVQSQVVDIKSEYRVLVFRDEIVNINYCNGDATVLPDIQIIKEMVCKYMWDAKRPEAYTLDVAVTDRQTVILEVHPFVSIGLYGYMIGSVLPMCYRLGIDYYININKELEKCEIV